MNHFAAVPARHRWLAFASMGPQASLPAPEPVPPMPPQPTPSPDRAPPPLEIPPRVPPEIREPDMPGEHIPIGDEPRLPTPMRH